MLYTPGDVPLQPADALLHRRMSGEQTINGARVQRIYDEQVRRRRVLLRMAVVDARGVAAQACQRIGQPLLRMDELIKLHKRVQHIHHGPIVVSIDALLHGLHMRLKSLFECSIFVNSNLQRRLLLSDARGARLRDSSRL